MRSRHAYVRPRANETIDQERRRQYDHEQHIVAKALAAHIARRWRKTILFHVSGIENAVGRDPLPAQQIRSLFDQHPAREERFLLGRLIGEFLAIAHGFRKLARISLP